MCSKPVLSLVWMDHTNKRSEMGVMKPNLIVHFMRKYLYFKFDMTNLVGSLISMVSQSWSVSMGVVRSMATLHDYTSHV